MSARNLPLVSVVVPNYNYGRYLPEAIDSALAQSHCNVEVLVVDDGSTDESDEVLHAYRHQVRCFRQERLGVSAARNRGIRESRGELVALLDADDTWHRLKLERQIELLDGERVGMVYCGVQYMDLSGKALGVRLAGARGNVLKQLALLQDGILAGGSSALIRRECFERVGLFDTALSTSADWDMWRRIACHFEIDVVSEPLVRYRLHSSAMHLDVPLFERDQTLAFAKMFADSEASEVHPLRHQCYGNLYRTLAGSYFQAGRWRKFLRYAARSVVTSPANLCYFCQFPLRRLRKRWNSYPVAGPCEPVSEKDRL